MKKKSILIFAYYSYKDPVFQSAVLPYFIDFPEKEKYHFTLLTFEQDIFLMSESERSTTLEYLKKNNIEWVNKKWHSGRFKIIKKAFDFIYSLIFTLSLIKKNKVEIIYSEGFPGAIITHFLCQLSGKKHVVHTFEPHADYMIESGVWKKENWEARLVKNMEIKIANKAFAILTATEAYIKKFNFKPGKTLFKRVPSCVDLELFQFYEEQRIQKRNFLKIDDQDRLLVYLGKFGGMYWDEELFDLFDFFQKNGANSYKLLIISKDDSSQFKHRINDNVFWISSPREEVPNWLCAADLAICGIKNIPSRRFSSPIKNGEYWAMQLNTIIPQGISDDYLIAENEKIGFVLNNHSKTEYQKLLNQIESHPNTFDKNIKARTFVENDRSVTRFQVMYHELFQL